MRCSFAQGVLTASAAFGVAAVITFLTIFAPFAGAEQLPAASLYAILVVLPYAALIAVCRMANDRVSRATATITSIVVALIGGYVYLSSFGYNDGEYVYAYFIVPIIQAPFAVAALAVVLWRRGRKSVAA